jgi:hypothetical protein
MPPPHPKHYILITASTKHFYPPRTPGFDKSSILAQNLTEFLVELKFVLSKTATHISGTGNMHQASRLKDLKLESLLIIREGTVSIAHCVFQHITECYLTIVYFHEIPIYL